MAEEVGAFGKHFWIRKGIFDDGLGKVGKDASAWLPSKEFVAEFFLGAGVGGD